MNFNFLNYFFMNDNVHPVFKPILNALTTPVHDLSSIDVVITRQNWYCTAGYCRTASVRKNDFKGIKDPHRYSRYTHWGKHLFDPPRRLEISDPKNCDYGKPPNPDPFEACENYCKENGLSFVIEWHEATE